MRVVSIVSLIIGVGVFVPVIFWPAGSWTWPEGWIYLVLVGVNFLINFGYLWRVNRALIVQRMSLGAGTKPWDVVWAICFGPVFLR